MPAEVNPILSATLCRRRELEFAELQAPQTGPWSVWPESQGAHIDLIPAIAQAQGREGISGRDGN